MRQIGIIGGGASGMMAAIAAANTSIKDTEITILERRDRIGRKILATGNGKCNLGNTDFSPKRDYRSHDPYRLPEFFARFQTSDTIRFFEERGLYLTEKNGYLYPYSGQASTVLDFFREELERKKVRIVCDCRIQKLCMQKSGWQVFTDQGQYHFDRLIISCGTAAGIPPKEALGTGSLTAAFAFKQYPYLPALTALRCEEKFYKSIAGVRCPAAITVEIPGRKKLCESGELQLTDYGISGIPVFQLSAAVSEALQTNKKISASIDFFPAVPLSKWNEFCCRQYQACCGKHVRFLAQGILPSKLAQLFIERSPLKAQDIVTAANKNAVFSMLQNMRALKTVVIGTNPAQNAQVCTGGISLQEVTDDLEAKRFPGLYLCGELLDVDGRCGGYNLQWAWTSGQIAGTASAREE